MEKSIIKIHVPVVKMTDTQKKLLKRLDNLARNKYMLRKNDDLLSKLALVISHLKCEPNLNHSSSLDNQFIIRKIFPEEALFVTEAQNLISQQLELSVSKETGLQLVELVICSNYQLSVGKQEFQALITLIMTLVSAIASQLAVPSRCLILTNQRFINHLKFLAIRILKKESDSLKADTDIYGYIKAKYPTSFEIANAAGAFIAETYQFDLSTNELCYLALHLEKA